MPDLVIYDQLTAASWLRQRGWEHSMKYRNCNGVDPLKILSFIKTFKDTVRWKSHIEKKCTNYSPQLPGGSSVRCFPLSPGLWRRKLWRILHIPGSRLLHISKVRSQIAYRGIRRIFRRHHTERAWDLFDLHPKITWSQYKLCLGVLITAINTALHLGSYPGREATSY